MVPDSERHRRCLRPNLGLGVGGSEKERRGGQEKKGEKRGENQWAVITPS